MKKQFLVGAIVATTMTATASAALAQGLLMPGAPVAPTAPVHAPVVVTHPAFSMKMMQVQTLTTYRQVRAFWLSRAIVR